MDEDVCGLCKSVRSHIDTYICRRSSLKWCLIFSFARIMTTALKDARYPTIPVDEENGRLKCGIIGVSVNLAFGGYCPSSLGYDRERIALGGPRGGPAEARTKGDVVSPWVRRREPISDTLPYSVTCQAISAFPECHGNLVITDISVCLYD